MEQAPLLDYYPSYDNPWFQYELTRKIELIKIGTSEDRYAFQMLLSYLMHYDSPFGEMLLAADAGVGKSRCVIFLMSLYFRYINDTDKFKDDDGNHTIGNNMKPIFMAQNSLTLDNFKEQLRATYPDLFKSKKYTNISSVRREHTKGVKQYVEMLKYDTFSKVLNSMSDEQIVQMYDGRLIVCDEAHYIRVKEKMYGTDYKNTYTQISRFLGLVRGKKVLVTATPAYADVSHFTSLFNLIIPKGVKPMNPETISELQGDELIEYLAPYVTGKVSLMKQSFMPKKISDKGSPIIYYATKDKPIRIPTDTGSRSSSTFISVICVTMSRFQQSIYSEILQKNIKGTNNPAQRSLELDLRCISNWVFPDRTYGKSSFNSSRDVSYLDEDDIISDIKTWVLYNKDSKRYEFTSDMKKSLKSKGIAYYSPKYYSICKDVIRNYKRGLPGFTFSFFYESGVVILGLLIEWLSIQWYENYRSLRTKPEGDKYIEAKVMKDPFIIYSGKMTANQIINEGAKPRITIVPQTQANAVVSNIKELFNHHLNRQGRYLSNIIGSEKISTSTNLSNGIVFKCTGAVWTPGEYTQASDRIVRSDSQTWKPVDQREVYIHNYASSLADGEDLPEFSVEEKMYIRCDEKYRCIEKLMSAMERFNVCGPLFRKRNNMPDDYTFYGYDKVLERVRGKLVWIERPFDLPYDNSSYCSLFKPHKKPLNDVVSFILKERSVITMTQLYEILGNSEVGSKEDLLYSVQTLIRDNTKVTDAYGCIKYVKNDGDKLYLSSSANINDCLDIYYSDNLYLKSINKSYDKEVMSSAAIILDSIDVDRLTCESLQSLKYQIINSTPNVQSYLLESCILHLFGDKGTVIREIMKHRFYVLENQDKMTIIHTVYHTSKSKGTTNRNMKQMVSKLLLRIYTERDVDPTWRFCMGSEDSIYISKINEYISHRTNKAIKRAKKNFDVEVIGTVNTADYIFKIYDRSGENIRMKKSGDGIDRRSLSSGSQSSKWKPSDILDYLYKFKVPSPDPRVDYGKVKRKTMIDAVISSRVKDIPSDNDLLKYYYSFSLAGLTSRNILCSLLQERLEDLDLIVYT